VAFEIRFRRANPAIAVRNGWTDDQREVERYVDESNAQRCLANGWLNFVEISDVPILPPHLEPGQKKTSGIRSVAEGLKVITEWLGSGKKPVSRDLAEKRAAICATCPSNNGGDWKAYFTQPVANQIRFLLGVKHDLALSTAVDDRLTVCSACDCTLALKIWAPLDIIVAHTSENVWNKFDSRCWLLAESGRALKTPSKEAST